MPCKYNRSNIYEEIYKPFQLYKYIEMTNFAIDKSGEGFTRLVSRKLDSVIQAMVLLLMSILCIVCWARRLKSDYMDLFVTLFCNIITAFSTAGMGVMVVTGLVRNQRLETIVYQLIEFDKRISSETAQMQLFYRKTCSDRILLIKMLMIVVPLAPNMWMNMNLKSYVTLKTVDLIIYYLFFIMILISSSLYCSLILQCYTRIKCANDYIQKLLLGTETIACIETKLTPVVNICYRLEDIKTELCGLIDIVEDINGYFEVQLFVQVGNLFLSVLWSAYYFIVSSGKTFELVLALRFEYMAIMWSVICIIDFYIEVYIYQRLLAEVSW